MSQTMSNLPLIKEPFRREETFALLAKELAKSAEAYLERPYGMENEVLRFALYVAIETYDNYENLLCAQNIV